MIQQPSGVDPLEGSRSDLQLCTCAIAGDPVVLG
jgi:hypothetical protein